MAFDPTTEDAGIDGAALASDLFESVMQRRVPVASVIPHIASVPDEIGRSPIAVHDRSSGFEKSRQLLAFRLLVLGGIDTGCGVAEFGNTFLSEPQDRLADDVVPFLERGESIPGEPWFASGDEAAQER